jgi:hypothetical protein
MLLAPLQRGSQCDPLTSLALMEAAASVVCDPGCRTTDTPLLNMLLEQLAALGQPLFALFGHPAGEWQLMRRPAAASGAAVT